eukprot:11219822-Lingulodinium_polyedra.AAC.1
MVPQREATRFFADAQAQAAEGVAAFRQGLVVGVPAEGLEGRLAGVECSCAHAVSAQFQSVVCQGPQRRVAG